MLTVEQHIFRHASTHPDKTAVKSGKECISYSQLQENILCAKAFFESIPDYSPGRAVIMAANKNLEFLYLYFGAHMAGLAVVPIDSETNPTRFQQIQKDVEPLSVIGFSHAGMTSTPVHLSPLTTHLSQQQAAPTFPSEDAIADILFTTGTTGIPKGVPLTFGNEAAAVSNINAYIQNTPDDIELLALPVSHSFGLGRIRCCLANGQTLIFLNSFVNTKKLFRTIEEEGVTGFTMVPASWRFLQKMTGNRLADYVSQLRYIEMGSAYLSAEEKQELANLLPRTRLVMHYGLTEASRSAFLEFHDTAHLHTVGKAAPNTDIQVYDENGQRLPLNADGEICIRGAHVAHHYLRPLEDTFFDGNYFRTGDLGHIDAEGYIHLKSRIKELINVGGKKVAPTEIEEPLLHIPGIRDCACIGVPDSNGILGEVVKAFIVKDADADITFEAIGQMLSTQLEGYKLPVLYEWTDAIPRTANGKIQRNLLKHDTD